MSKVSVLHNVHNKNCLEINEDNPKRKMSITKLSKRLKTGKCIKMVTSLIIIQIKITKYVFSANDCKGS